MDVLRHDIIFALRSLRRNAVYSTAVIVTLALGIGANTAMFSVLRGVLLAPLPQSNGDRVVRVYQPNVSSANTGLSPLEMADYRAAATIEAIAEYHSMPFTFIGTDEPQRLQTGVVSADFFDVLGVRALLGRTFNPGEDRPGSEPVLVLSWEYWQRVFGGDPGVIGTTLRMNDRTHTVVGVLPRIPQYPDENDVYMPASSCPFRSAPSWSESRTARQPAFALLRAGVTTETAEAELRSIAVRLHEAYPEAYPADRGMTVATVPLAELMTRHMRPSLLVLLAATAFLLLIVCANVVNLALVRLMRRDTELATRLALGASRARIAQQVLTETVLLGLAGAATGLLVAWATIAPLSAFLARFTTRAWEIRLDAGVLAFTAAVGIAAGVLGGLVPVLLRLRTLGARPGRADARSTPGARHNRLRGALIVTQVAVSLVLLVGAGLLIRSVLELQRADAGFDPGRVLTARLDLNWTRYADADATAQFYRTAAEQLAAMPGIEAVAIAAAFPLNGNPSSQISVVTDGNDIDATEFNVAVNTVSDRYFDVLGVPVLRGRSLEDADARQDAPVAVVVTQASAQRLFGDADPLGRRISSDGGASWGTIVGVVGDVRQELEADYEAQLFVHHYRFHGLGSRLLVRGSLPPAQLERSIRDVVTAIDRDQPLTDVRTIAQFRDDALAPRRASAALLGGFALLALVITAVGLSGIIAFFVAERRAEISIRVALGASRGRVLAMVLRQAVVLTAVGLVIGTAAAALLTRMMTALLFGVPPTDALTFVTVAVVLLAVAGVAAALPARKALLIEPVRALRGG